MGQAAAATLCNTAKARPHLAGSGSSPGEHPLGSDGLTGADRIAFPYRFAVAAASSKLKNLEVTEGRFSPSHVAMAISSVRIRWQTAAVS